jgi:hypothetical protein
MDPDTDLGGPKHMDPLDPDPVRNTGFQFRTLLLRDFFGGEFPVEREVVIISWDDMEKI